jgi:hypothetical protein
MMREDVAVPVIQLDRTFRCICYLSRTETTGLATYTGCTPVDLSRSFSWCQRISVHCYYIANIAYSILFLVFAVDLRAQLRPNATSAHSANLFPGHALPTLIGHRQQTGYFLGDKSDSNRYNEPFIRSGANPRSGS